MDEPTYAEMIARQREAMLCAFMLRNIYLSPEVARARALRDLDTWTRQRYRDVTPDAPRLPEPR